MEYLDVVDEEDRVIGREEKSQKYVTPFISRNVTIFVKDSKGNFIITKRAPHKTTHANLFDASTCGNVAAGESYEDAAKRELKEEIGVDSELILLKKKFTDMTHNGKPLQFFTTLFLAHHDGDVTLNKELTEYKKFSFEELEKITNNQPELFVPAFVEDFKEVGSLLK
jgi:isopentenyldiphosphate isomerase